MRDAEDYFFQEAEAYLPQGPSSIIPVDDIIETLVPILAPDIRQDDKMGREAAFELIVVLFMQVGIIEVKKSEACLYGCCEVVVEVADGGADEVGAPGLYLVAE